MITEFQSCRRKLNRARHHIQDLDSKIKTFAHGKPYTCSIEPDPDDPEQEVHRLQLQLPSEYAEIAADAIHNLRSALDQAAYAVSVACGQTGLAHFPVGVTAAGFDNAVKGWFKKTPPDVQTMFRTFNAY